MKIHEYIEKCKKEGYEGLYCPDGECACMFDLPCDLEEYQEIDDCKPGYVIKKDQYNETEKELWSEYDFIISKRNPNENKSK